VNETARGTRERLDRKNQVAEGAAELDCSPHRFEPDVIGFAADLLRRRMLVEAPLGQPVNSDSQLRELSLSDRDLRGLLGDLLARGGSLRFKAKGYSMSPFIRDGDVITVAPISPAKLCWGDIAAFRRCGTDHLTIHRVVGVQDDSFLMKGDNAPHIDGLIPASEVLGRVIKVDREGRRLRLGLGPDRALIAILSRAGLLPVVLKPTRKLYQWLFPRSPGR
jgi:hypothetical protein